MLLKFAENMVITLSKCRKSLKCICTCFWNMDVSSADCNLTHTLLLFEALFAAVIIWSRCFYWNSWETLLKAWFFILRISWHFYDTGFFLFPTYLVSGCNNCNRYNNHYCVYYPVFCFSWTHIACFWHFLSKLLSEEWIYNFFYSFFHFHL